MSCFRSGMSEDDEYPSLRESTHPGWTIADAERIDLTHLEIRCSCGRITQIPWGLLPPWPKYVSVSSMAGRLVCKKCGTRPQIGQMRAMSLREAGTPSQAFWGPPIR